MLKRHGDREVGDDQRKQVVHQPELLDEQEERHHQRDVGDHPRRQHEIDRRVASDEPDLGQRIGRRHADQQVQQRHRHRHDEAVFHRRQQVAGGRRNEAAGGGVALAAVFVGDLLLAAAEDGAEVVQRRLVRHPVRRHRGDLGLRLERRRHEPGNRRQHIEREQQRTDEQQRPPAETAVDHGRAAADGVHNLRLVARMMKKASKNVASAMM